MAKYPFLEQRETHPHLPSEMVAVELHEEERKEKLLAQNTEELLPSLLSKYTEEGLQPQRIALLQEIEDAASDRNDWGLKLALNLCKSRCYTSDIWQPLFHVFGRASTKLESRQGFLRVLAGSSQLVRKTVAETIRFIEQGIANSEDTFGAEELEQVLHIASEAWPALSKCDEKRIVAAEEWLALSINHDAGVLMQVELNIIGRMRRLRGEAWSGLAGGLAGHLDTVIEGESWASEMARILLASQVRFLFQADPAWTTEQIFKLFDWDVNERRALQAWHGYLTWGEWLNDYLYRFLPLYRMSWNRMNEFPADLRGQLTNHIAFISVFGTVDDLVRTRWLFDFVQEAHAEDRKAWALSTAQALKKATPESRKKVWQGWMKEYWQSRIDGNPLPLIPDEVEAMIQWALELESEFSEALLCLLKSPRPQPHHRFVYTPLSESGIPDSHPQETAILVAWLLRSEKILPFDYDRIHQTVKRIAPRISDRKHIIAICSELVRLGDQGANNLLSGA